ncbi:MAG: pentapeptide repeat-containing protein [Gammaproteobacteria bacterium]|nr:pentapeptide repeat-containing protein [Gammaproteobacteria bacterium]
MAELIDTKDNINNFCFRDQTLTGAEIENLCFDNCEFEHCRFNGEGMRSLTFADCFFHDCRFNSQPLRDCEFINCRFYHSDNDTTVDFSYCDISMSKFIHCDLTRVDFKRASLYGCEMKTCKMVGVNFDTTTTPSRKYAVFNIAKPYSKSESKKI